MARYRVGDKYLSEGEYEQHVSENWKIGLFIVGAIFFGMVTAALLKDFEISKELRFVAIISASVVSGYLMAKLSHIIRIMVGLSVLGCIAWLILSFLWNSL
ncbi:TPA: hypothetical protein NJ595_004601 [Vibrio parahaemolyticus]|nr:hypothetical protein [Vibrio parahaemolyticus]